MIWLGNFLAAVVTWFASYLGISLAKKTIYAVAAMGAFLAITAAFIAASKLLVVGIVAVLPAWAAQGFAQVVPPNLPACLGAYSGVRLAVWIYRYQMENLKLASYIT
ncbi:hypothetical protein AZSI13_07610 [Azospira sp. I13]|uniref:DUF5455 family protein n=1 Tax=Azospira sp. I13 TaxID=1765050 RepID=UPI000D4B573D|nr:DUF5455 family protein [Azospira sp. I13]GBG01434.1 hypothetical protein AZSI13_07610 [Azospira sp. I13]